jgi:hypothetical protein
MCEYCRLYESYVEETFWIDHVIARKHGGPTSMDNLALCCSNCNLHKGTDLAGLDPLSGQLTPLFNPRTQRWEEHFEWSDLEVVGATAVGRTGVRVLQMNDPVRILVRIAMRADGMFPPTPLTGEQTS